MLREIESQLEVLNQTATQINDLENQLVSARSGFHVALSEQSDRLKALGAKLGRSVRLARPFYEARLKQLHLLQQIQIAAEKYNLANDTLVSSRDALSRLEQVKPSPVELDTLESLNRAVSQVNNAVKNVSESKAEHERLLRSYNDAEHAVRQLERKHKLAIRKAHPYFIHKQLFEQRMQEAKLRVDVCTEKVNLCKTLYAEAMLELERISNTLHLNGPTVTYKFIGQNEEISDLGLVRGQGVGAESPNTLESPAASTGQPNNGRLLGTPEMELVDLADEAAGKQTDPIRVHNPRFLMDGLLEHVQQAKFEIDAIQLAVASPMDIPDSSLLQPCPFTGALSPTPLPSLSPPLYARPRTPGSEDPDQDLQQQQQRSQNCSGAS